MDETEQRSGPDFTHNADISTSGFFLVVYKRKYYARTQILVLCYTPSV